MEMKLISNNTNMINNSEIIDELNINYDLIKKELEEISNKIDVIDTKRYYYKDDKGTIFAVEDMNTNVINIFYKVDYRSTKTPSEHRLGALAIVKDFFVFNRDVNGDLLCSSTDAAFLDLRTFKGRYKMVLENSILVNYVNDKFLNEYFKNNLEATNLLDPVYHNSTDGYICKIGGVNLCISKTTRDYDKLGLNILCFNGETRDLGNIECPVYKYYRKKRDWNYTHSAGRNIKKSTENMKNCNFNDYSFSKDISNKYKELFDDLSKGKLLK